MIIGFAGLGAMGKRICTNVIKGGHEVTVFDVYKPATEVFASEGIKVAATVGEIAIDADVVFMSLPNSAIVEDVVLGTDGILQYAKEGAVITDLSSITPSSIRKVHAAAKKKGVDVIDAPVSGGVAGAEKGTLTLMVGGDKAVIEKVLPVLELIGSKIHQVGDIGAGNTMKLVNNLLLGANMVAVAEALTLGAKCGLDPATMFEIISASSGNSYALMAKYPNFISKGNFEPGFMVDLQYKDLQLAIDTAHDLQQPLLVGTQAQQFYEMARAKGLGTKDISAVIQLYEEWAGVKVRERE